MTTGEDFVARFSEYWARPSVAGLAELLADDVVLRQPLSRPMHGLAAAQRGFATTFRRLPDLRATVEGWSATGERVFVEFRLRATLAGRPLEWPVVDRFTLRDGKAIERVSYFDGLPLLARVLAHPSAWWRWWRAAR
jgi:ketosteroid isomerase-like protein